jgi:hypothetical protein
MLQFQSNLSGNIAIPKGNQGDKLKPTKGICCEPCMTAKEDKCVCRCGGAYHGILRRKKVDNGYETGLTTIHGQVREDYETFEHLTSEQAEPFRKAITDHNCNCGQDLTGEPILRYDHDAGWKVKGIEKRQWLFITCPKCAYEMALWKMGVPRNLGETEESAQQ